MTIYQLINDKGNAANNQFVVVNNGATYFQSYDSVIAKVEGSKVTLSEDWDYSKTTLKHLYIFLRGVGISVNSKKEVERAIKDNIFNLVEEISI